MPRRAGRDSPARAVASWLRGRLPGAVRHDPGAAAVVALGIVASSAGWSTHATPRPTDEGHRSSGLRQALVGPVAADLTRDSQRAPREDSARIADTLRLPRPDSALLADPDTLRLPRPDSALLAEPDTLRLPRRDSTLLAQPDTLHIPGRDSASTVEPDTLAFDFAGDGMAADSVGVRWEIGAASEVSNEQFYEDAFVDTVALGRRLVSDPEHRVAGVAWLSVAGTRDGGRGAYNVQSDLGLGDKRQRGSLSGWWRQKAGSGFTFSAVPRVELAHDRTFGRDLTHWLGSASTRLRRDWQDDLYGLELGAFAERFRAAGTGADFLPDRDVGRLAVIAQRSPLFGAESELGYAATLRVFPDSADRDHLEHRFTARGKIGNGGLGHSLAIEAAAARRGTRQPARTSRDAFREGAVDADAIWRLHASASIRLRMGGEALRYDRRDSTVFFDHRIARGSLAWQLERDRWHVGLGPRVERLWSDDAPDEEYSEWAGVLEWEWLGLGPFWEIAPAAGWRDYRETAASAPEGGPPIPTARSPYAFYELSAIADQPLPGSLRLRSQLQARWERNTVRSRDARSLYFSIDVRRLF